MMMGIILLIAVLSGLGGYIIAKRLANKIPFNYTGGGVSVDFYNDLQSPNPDKRKIGSHFWITCRNMSLTLYKNNWGAEIDYKLRDGGFIETIHSVHEEDMPKLMKLCNNAKSDKAITCYMYNKFSPDGYAVYLNILEWFKENGIKYSTHWDI